MFAHKVKYVFPLKVNAKKIAEKKSCQGREKEKGTDWKVKAAAPLPVCINQAAIKANFTVYLGSTSICILPLFLIMKL